MVMVESDENATMQKKEIIIRDPSMHPCIIHSRHAQNVICKSFGGGIEQSFSLSQQRL
jgi:hypothetical protein